MLANRVHETTTTTGTGNITLAGAAANMRTFTSQFATSQRFSYFIDDEAGNFENGIGYLSDSVTLVRETVLDSSNAGALVAFGAGTKQVFIADSVGSNLCLSLGLSNLGSTYKAFVSAHHVRTTNTQSLTADRIYYMPFVVSRAVFVDLIGCAITTGNGNASNKLHLGLYDVVPATGEPGALLRSATDLDPSSAAMVSGTFTEILLQPGVYWVGVWCDAAPTLRANDGSIIGQNPFSINVSTSMAGINYLYTNSQSSLTDMPSAGNAGASNTAGGTPPVIFLGHS